MKFPNSESNFILFLFINFSDSNKPQIDLKMKNFISQSFYCFIYLSAQDINPQQSSFFNGAVYAELEKIKSVELVQLSLAWEILKI